MSQPKKKTSKRRRDIRRHNTHRKEYPTALGTCPETNNLVRSHTYTMEAILARNANGGKEARK